jgi:hypothetical protein
MFIGHANDSRPDGGAVTFTSTGACTVSGNTVHLTGAGSCTIKADQAGDGNYNPASQVARTFAIGKATPSVGATGGTFTYDGTAHAGTGNATGVGGAVLTPVTLSYNGTGSTTYGPTAVAPTNAGTYTVTANYAADVNYNAASSGAVALIVNPKALTIKANDRTKTYGDVVTFAGTEFTPTGLVGSETVGSVTLASAGAPADAGVGGSPYSITPSAATGGTFTAANYTITYSAGSLTVGRKAASVSAVAASKVYGDADPILATTNSGFIAADLGASKITFSANRAAGETVAGGPYVITAAANDNGTHLLDNYQVTATPANFTITPKAASVTPAAASKLYGSADPTFTGTLAGFLAGDNVAADYGRTAGESVAGSPYTISATLTPAAVLTNYTITYNTAVFTINKKPASVTPSAASKTYGDADPALSGALAGFIVADGVTATYSRAGGETVLDGPYAITATLSPAAVLGNYDITYNPASFTINPKTASVSPIAANKTYGAADPVFTGTLTGFVGTDNVTAAYSRTAGESVAGNPYTISATLSPAGVLSNYSVTYNTATFTINKKPASVTPAAASKTYGDAEPTLSGTLAGFIAGDNVTASYTRTAGETVTGGPYVISATLSPTAALGNYDITSNTANFTINPKAASVTPAAASKIYGAADPAFTGTLTGFLSGDGVTATYSRTAGETVAGSPYTISAVLTPLGVLANYNITYQTAPFTINRKPASIIADPKFKSYGDADPAFTGSWPGFLPADGVTATFARSPTGETPSSNNNLAPASYTIIGTAAPAAVLGNYDITNTTATFAINNDTPVITSLTGPSAPVALGSPVTVTGTFSDHGFSSDSYTISSTWTAITGNVSVPNVGAASYNGTTGTFTITAPNTIQAGVYTVTVNVMDRWNVSSTPVSVSNYVVVYDPSGGFVTGGGWIVAAAESCVQGIVAGVCTGATGGRANFGFVSKYAKGATTPSGNTEFQFQAGNLNFKSTAYQWLVVSGARAQFKGSGTINGQPGYDFILTAVDGALPGGNNQDAFRIKITYNGDVVFDNQNGASDSDPLSGSSTALVGGSISIKSK